MTKGIPLSPREEEEFDRVFRVMDNLDQGSENENKRGGSAGSHHAEQIPLFEEAV